MYDLGDLWLRKTGFPVVFAVFVVRKSIVEKYASEISAVVSSYHGSLGHLEADKAQVVSKASAKYPDIIYDINGYFNLLQFKFNANLKDALMFYFSRAGDMGLIKKVKELSYLSFE
jgi:chorismate dehydratase